MKGRFNKNKGGGSSNTEEKIGIVEKRNQEVTNFKLVVGRNLVVVAQDINKIKREGKFEKKGFNLNSMWFLGRAVDKDVGRIFFIVAFWEGAFTVYIWIDSTHVFVESIVSIP